MARRVLFVTLLIISAALLSAQERPPFQTDFPADELAQRRGRVMDAIGADGRRLKGPPAGSCNEDVAR